MAIAAVRATRESIVDERGERHEVIVGTPQAGETLDGITYDGRTEIALFPGDLPDNPEALFDDDRSGALRFLRFMPPQRLEKNAEGNVVLPHIRFDRAIDYLIGDWLK
jgi:hypothetical protein